MVKRPLVDLDGDRDFIAVTRYYRLVDPHPHVAVVVVEGLHPLHVGSELVFVEQARTGQERKKPLGAGGHQLTQLAMFEGRHALEEYLVDANQFSLVDRPGHHHLVLIVQLQAVLDNRVGVALARVELAGFGQPGQHRVGVEHGALVHVYHRLQVFDRDLAYPLKNQPRNPWTLAHVVHDLNATGQLAAGDPHLFEETHAVKGLDVCVDLFFVERPADRQVDLYPQRAFVDTLGAFYTDLADRRRVDKHHRGQHYEGCHSEGRWNSRNQAQ